MAAHYHRGARRKYDAKRLGEFVAKTRRRLTLGLTELAKRAGMTTERFVEVETGVAMLGRDELVRLARALSLSEIVVLEEAGLITHVHSRRRCQRGGAA